MPQLSIIIVTYNTSDLTSKCLESIYQKHWNHSFEIILVDNGSKDNTLDTVKNHFPKVKIIKNGKNIGFGAGNNQALKIVDSDYVLLLNSDTEVSSGSLDNLLDSAKRMGFDIASCKLLNPDGSLQPNSGELPFFFSLIFWLSGIDDIIKPIFVLPSYHQTSNKYYTYDHQVGWVSGTAMLISKKVIEEIGLLDEKIFMYAEDVEYCFRASQKGFKVGWIRQAEIIHLGGGSSNDPKYNQWLGEFKGLIYIYEKYFTNFPVIILKGLIYFFILIRMIIFALIGRINYSITYAKVLNNI